MLIKTVRALAATVLVSLVVPATAAATETASSTTRSAGSTASLPEVAYSGAAFGTQVSALDKIIASGRTAYSSVSCTADGGKRVTQEVAGVRLPGIGRIGAVTSLAQTTETATYKRTNTQAGVAGVSLLGGRITADALKVNSSAYARSGGTRSGVNSFSFVNLKIGSTKIPANVGKNTKVTVPGVAEVTVNQQSKGTNKDGRYSVQTNGVVITLLPGNPLGLPADTRVVIGSSTSALDEGQGNALHGGAGFSTRVRALDGTVRSAPTALAGVPCLGGTNSNTLATMDVPLLLSSGTTSTTATGASTDTRTWSRVVNRTASPRILGGLISADAVVADTTVSRSGGKTTHSDRSSLVGLRVAGRKVTAADLDPNSRIEIPGVAKVIVHKQAKGTARLTTTMLYVELLSARVGLPKGAIIEVGYSSSQLR